ncbi:MAG: ComF family protein [Burkholderiaceae bacterium]
MNRMSRALDWFYPAACQLCGAPGTLLCDACRLDATAHAIGACERCAIPVPPGIGIRVCGRCLRRKPAFDRTLAAALYEAPFDQLVRGLKYGATLAYAPLFAELLAARLAALETDDRPRIDVIVPVPLSRERTSTRGFNQSLEIGRALARILGKPLDASSVLRVHDTRPQATLPLAARRRNMRGAFAVIDARRARFSGAHVAVVDDVMTTGSTVDELARTLKRAGTESVVNLVVARTA